jgi:DNA mismatch repair ATPase MutS
MFAEATQIFGVGSLFELINAAHTQNGRSTLAAWLLEPAGAEETLGRQEAIKELRPKMDLRERLGFPTGEVQAWIASESSGFSSHSPRHAG